MRSRSCILPLVCLFASAAFVKAEETSVTATGLLREMNLARQNPTLYASYVEEMRSHFDGKQLVLPGGTRIRTKEGRRALDEAIRFLQHTRPQAPLSLSAGMCRAAADHCADQVGGRRGHDGSDRSNPGSRISRYGQWSGGWAENIAYGKTNARDIIVALIIDDGQPARKHRKNIFNPKWNVTGAAFGPHAIYRTVCSMEFAGGYSDQAPVASPALVARNF
jgi:uncharacterized protein YkwD